MRCSILVAGKCGWMLRESDGLKEGDKLLKAPPPGQPQLFHPMYPPAWNNFWLAADF